MVAPEVEATGALAAGPAVTAEVTWAAMQVVAMAAALEEETVEETREQSEQ